MKIVSVFRSPRKDEMYLYVDKREQLERVPEPLLEMFGAPEHVMDMPLTAERKLARVESTTRLLDDLDSKGYYLQMPPPKDDYMLDLFKDRPETGVR
ncbi:YcgL domain-containing protein [Marinobacterium sp. AK62]|uniref:YcgL domain-containing protein H9C73_12495 n=1 Tax=Marinobacterium alkalitolerans TaxID=1542925 RepID=A0ABS3ZCX1_9GAMM|nr:YcgL domain-containing protein [Marinobacterium alkalitolerans]MBP0049551.1 YcgL domain-containing protein [Marinobacterium alkalitolerans]